MPRKKHSPEQIITKLREAEVAMFTGSKVSEVCRQIGVTEQTYYRWLRRKDHQRLEDQTGGSKPPWNRLTFQEVLDSARDAVG